MAYRVMREAEKLNLSGKDILTITKGKCKVMLYEELEQYNTIEDAMGEHGAIALLYQEQKFFGHWACVLDQGNYIEIYDSYGVPVDDELKFSEFNMRKHEGTIQPHLTVLLNKSGRKVIHNSRKLQLLRQNVNTCGRYCALRILMRDLPMDKFNKFIGENKYLKFSLIT